MPLNIGGSGTGKPFCKYNAKADKWFVRGAAGEDAEIPRPSFVIDFENIATGWLLFREGQARHITRSEGGGMTLLSSKWLLGTDRYGRRVTLTREGNDFQI